MSLTASIKGEGISLENKNDAPRVVLREDADCRNRDNYLPVVESLVSELGLSSVAARVLFARGINSVSAARDFLAPTFKDHLPSPEGIKNIGAAVDILCNAISTGEPITVFTDFDVDGLTSGSQLLSFLRKVGAKVRSYTPNRFNEGYGLSLAAIEKLAKEGTKLLVTVDCGISNHDEILLAKKRGLKVVVIDHHQPHDLPKADVIVNPAQDGCPFQHYRLAAAGLVWMVLIVLRKELRERGIVPAESIPDPKHFLDLAALGTICDMVPLVGVNRLIASRGLEAIRSTTRIGLIALKNVAGADNNKPLNVGHIGFQIGPRINAVGRLGDAGDVIELFTTENSIRAQSLADGMNHLNDRRRKVEDSVKEQCLNLIRENSEIASRGAFALFGEDFHVGVIGIVAQRLVEEFYRPSAVMGLGESVKKGEIIRVIKGSVRSIKGFHVAEALQALSPLLISHGGHAEAGGFTLACDKLEEFTAGFIELAERVVSAEMRRREVTADLEVTLKEIDFDVVRDLQRLGPFGVGNPSPTLITTNLDVLSVVSIGEKHLKVQLTDGVHHGTALAWSALGHPHLRKGMRVTVAHQPDINSYKGISTVQLIIKHAWPA